MKIHCALSSIEFSCDHFPAYLNSKEAHHPIFDFPQKKLLSFIGKHYSGGLTQTDSYLLFLAILKSTDIVDFRVAAFPSEKALSIMFQEMENLCKTVSRMNSVANPSVHFPRYVVSPDTKDLSSVKYWIENWNSIYRDFLDGYKSAHVSAKLIQREAALERLIKNPSKPISEYSTQLAEWAASAGNFPTFLLRNPYTGMETSCEEYWKILIQKCTKEDAIFSIRRTDLEMVLSHCEDNISMGSIFSNALFKVLKKALARQNNFLGLGDLDIGRTTYEILSTPEEEANTEAANIKAMVQASPETIPLPENYPSKLAYLKAKMRFEMKLKYGEN